MDSASKKQAESGVKSVAWFDPNEIDKTELDHFGDSLGSEEDKGIYKKIRNAMVNLYRAQPTTYLTVSSLKRLIPYDFCLLIKIHSFLESWELINCGNSVNKKNSNIFSRLDEEEQEEQEQEEEEYRDKQRMLESLPLDDSLQLVLDYLTQFVDENFVAAATLTTKALLPHYCNIKESNQLKDATSLNALLQLLQDTPELKNVNESSEKFPCVEKMQNSEYKLALLVIIKLQQSKMLRKARINDYLKQMTDVKLDKIDMQLDFLEKYEAVMNQEKRMMHDLFGEK